jgi:hypothetical protein
MKQLKTMVLAVSVALALGVVTNVQAKGGHDSARDKAERKAMQDQDLLAKGGHDSARDKAERKAMQDMQQPANSVA